MALRCFTVCTTSECQATSQLPSHRHIRYRGELDTELLPSDTFLMQAALSTPSHAGFGAPSLLRPCSACRSCSSQWFTPARRGPLRSSAVCRADLHERGSAAERCHHANSGIHSSVLRYTGTRHRTTSALCHAMSCLELPCAMTCCACACCCISYLACGWNVHCMRAATVQQPLRCPQAAGCGGAQRLGEHGHMRTRGAGVGAGLFTHGGTEKQRLRQIQDEVSGSRRLLTMSRVSSNGL